MADRAFISRFSPNRTAPETLEAIFVQRHRLAEVWLERLRDSVLTGVKHHLLAVGPRGCGKSHLAALLVYRLQRDAAVCERVRIARLPEDETTPSFWKFLLRILRALSAAYPEEFPMPARERLADPAPDRRSAVLTEYLLERLGGRTLLVVVENLDEVMGGLKEEGQRRWRAFLQHHPVAVTLATSQQLTKPMSSRTSPFFGFFQVVHLEPLTADEALALLRRIAEHTGRGELAAFLQTPAGRARVRAVRHLTGGNHRVFIILSEFATREKLDDLVTAFEELLDELTPYYQERLRWLPEQQREIVEYLCRQARTAQVKGIAADLFLSEQTAAAQLKSLRMKGYVVSEAVGRESRYELAEPLMRMCVEVKDPQREPIRLIVEFLRIWYEQKRVRAMLRRLPAEAELARKYYAAALVRQPWTLSPLEEALSKDLETARASGNTEEVVCLLVEQAATSEDVHVCVLAAFELSELGRHDESLSAADRAIAMNPSDIDAWIVLGYVLNELSRYDEAVVALDRAIALDPDNIAAWNNKGVSLFNLGRYDDALKACNRATRINVQYVYAWSNRGEVLSRLGRYEEALAACNRAVSLDPKYPNGMQNRARVLLRMGDNSGAKECFKRAIELDANQAGAYEGLAEAYVVQGEWDRSEAELLARFRLGPSTDNPIKSRYLPDLIAAIFQASPPATWEHRATRLVEIATAAREAAAPTDPVAVVGDSLVRSLTRPAYAAATAEAREAWAAAWERVAAAHPHLSLSVRLFGVGVRYLRSRDPRVLFDLVQEERAILRELFRLDEQPHAAES